MPVLRPLGPKNAANSAQNGLQRLNNGVKCSFMETSAVNSAQNRLQRLEAGVKCPFSETRAVNSARSGLRRPRTGVKCQFPETRAVNSARHGRRRLCPPKPPVLHVRPKGPATALPGPSRLLGPPKVPTGSRLLLGPLGRPGHLRASPASRRLLRPGLLFLGAPLLGACGGLACRCRGAPPVTPRDPHLKSHAPRGPEKSPLLRERCAG